MVGETVDDSTDDSIAILEGGTLDDGALEGATLDESVEAGMSDCATVA